MLRWMSVTLACLLLATVSARADIIVTPIGAPAYAPVDLHLFTAPIGTAASGYSEAFDTEQKLLPPPNHVPNPVLGIGPGAPHPGPYTHEFAQGISANGYREATTFTTSEYSNGAGVYLVFMLVPSAGAPNGSSPDVMPDRMSGPILPNAIFPLTVTGDTLTNGVFNDALGQFQVPDINHAGLMDHAGSMKLDGHSHIPFFFIDNFDFAMNPIPGLYEYEISIRDVAGNGYDIDASFQVLGVPEPATWALTGFAALAVVAVSRRRVRASV